MNADSAGVVVEVDEDPQPARANPASSTPMVAAKRARGATRRGARRGARLELASSRESSIA